MFLKKYTELSYYAYTSKYDDNAENIKNILFELIEKYIKTTEKLEFKEEIINIDDGEINKE